MPRVIDNIVRQLRPTLTTKPRVFAQGRLLRRVLQPPRLGAVRGLAA